MGLPFAPMSAAEHKLRVAPALEYVYHTRALLEGGERPGQRREHLFDWPDGLRLVVARELGPGEVEAHLHVSGSAFDNCYLCKRLKHGTPGFVGRLVDLIIYRLDDLGVPGAADLKLVGVSSPVLYLCDHAHEDQLHDDPD